MFLGVSWLRIQTLRDLQESQSALLHFLIFSFKHYVNVELIIYSIFVAFESMLLEAVIESIVSIYEGTNKERRLFSGERDELSMMISENDPYLEHAECYCN